MARVLVGFSLSLCFMTGCGSYRVTVDWELPMGYKGWVWVERANPKCPAALLTPTSVVIKVDSSGHGCVATPLPHRPQILRFAEVDESGRRRVLLMGSPGNGGQIWEYSPGSASNELMSIHEAVEFFVGTEAEYEKSKGARPQWWRVRATGDN
jgi:hypothetical protein